MLLAQGLQHQGQAFVQDLEKELTAKDVRIQAIEKGLEAAKELDEKNASARKITEEQVENMR